MISKQQQAEFLIEAMPYVRKYQNKILVIKYGGNAMQSEELKNSVMRDLTMLRMVGINVVLVHGGGPEINALLKKVNKESKFIDGLRYTDQETVEYVAMALAGKVNKSLVNHLQRNDTKAVGLCGIDGHMLLCEKQDERLGYVGKVLKVNPGIILDCLESGYIPVISTIGFGKDGEMYNVNADTAASYIAGALGAESLILMTDIKGLLANKDDESTLIKKVYVSDIPSLVNQGIISGGMIPKIECCKEAIRRGVNRVFITDGRINHSILLELLSDSGMGTMFINED
ncbi:MAG: acetylglutamate kinase [Clostridia bacterium]|nr:acetylglutamate kinase [Clostridia bacterium]